jgi:hypothetical protein
VIQASLYVTSSTFVEVAMPEQRVAEAWRAYSSDRGYDANDHAGFCDWLGPFMERAAIEQFRLLETPPHVEDAPSVDEYAPSPERLAELLGATPGRGQLDVFGGEVA